MNADFLDAHVRHWDDATSLFGAQRWANSDHLYGIAAECGLKRLMQAFGMPFDSTRDRPQVGADRVHANGIWARFESYRSGHLQGASYALSAVDPFSDWDIAQRYAGQHEFDEVRATAHRGAAAQVHKLIAKARIEGLI